jgi:hypothetical protein
LDDLLRDMSTPYDNVTAIIAKFKNTLSEEDKAAIIAKEA